ncbi:ABC transporter permease [Streptomyces sp. B-S-A8]|uniref:ABC transporter permease n=1 Tax=Streptomyces solicavernae TaxID=3043614 RepID=A0ABT6RZ56_9ACTN|nr:ABC transporter permease [Streptomyces sp. B-S-A8]MDI3388946.1 ABC transporter permease [Streptomyces sp. B-S-A8]
MSTPLLNGPRGLDNNPRGFLNGPRGFLKGPRWVELRLHRTALRATLAALLLAAALTVFLRWGASAYPPVDVDCFGPCEPTFLGFADGEHLLREAMNKASHALLLLPLLVGFFVAGPYTARELESGTHQLAWTQSVTPARWLASRLTTAAALSTGFALAAMAVFRFGSADLRGSWNMSWADRGVYEGSGPVLVAYCLFAVAVGTLTGLLVRRTLLAASLTGLVTGAVLAVLGSVRWQLWPVVQVSGPATTMEPHWIKARPPGSFMTDTGVTNAAGERFIARQCTPDQMAHFPCPSDTRITGWFLDYHPRSHFWYTQFVETGIVLALAAAAAYAAFRVLRRRTA